MKYLTGKITLGLLATTLSLSAKDPTLPYSILDMEQSMLQESAETDPFTPKGAEKLTDPNLLISRSPNRAGALEKALCSSSLTKKELKTLKKIYKQLLEDYATLSEEVKKLKLENAELKAENDAYKEEKKSTWERLKNWFFKLDTTKVLASVASGTFTLIAALIAILL